jgi:hypothetical protein
MGEGDSAIDIRGERATHLPVLWCDLYSHSRTPEENDHERVLES